ncbi:hypothetical protein BDV27DRAFT_81921 [Aspergillus caelatus]|uniref:Uncharacterized protein n=2 Tax=Aspergillus subgen. Circumdati TaxID=2720871 RepID=A0A5N6ZL55_9EURO|nr:uncharacterized protein BDV27DRAFT_81921 [Aspergillus caelatus]KAE8357676.1 hypothetical protein BDV27DRAFT_81921 [Aspergillus caelatus]KAE8412447.1 hypothetical protein BDV36DRAFT_304845 [Aspergillus pseudocaelatus]
MESLFTAVQTLLRETLKAPRLKPTHSNDKQPPNKQLHPTSISSEIHLTPFEELPPAYEPSTWWLDGHCPAHPHFDNADRIRLRTKEVKRPLFQCILEGCRILLERADNKSLLLPFDQHETLWSAAISVQKFGVVYLAARSECRDEFLPAVESNLDLFNEIVTFLSRDNNAIRAINYGVHRLVNSNTFTVDYQTKLVPPTAISSIGPNHVAVREKDFEEDSTGMLDKSSAIWDLHDFAHLTAASVCSELYGSKYFTHLIKLPSKLTALIRSPKMKTADPTPRCSDGVVFSELLTVLFTSEIEAVQRAEKTHTYASLVETLAEDVADYLMGERELQHLTTGVMLKAKKPISAVQLATLVQNKAYELTASEIEQRVMTRGGPAGDSRDELDGRSPLERIRFLAHCRRWLYFEVRNTIKHRAHKLAYKKAAERMLAQGDDGSITNDDRVLLEQVLDHIRYEGWESKGVVNLWQTVIDMNTESQAATL